MDEDSGSDSDVKVLEDSQESSTEGPEDEEEKLAALDAEKLLFSDEDEIRKLYPDFSADSDKEQQRQILMLYEGIDVPEAPVCCTRHLSKGRMRRLKDLVEEVQVGSGVRTTHATRTAPYRTTQDSTAHAYNRHACARTSSQSREVPRRLHS